MGIFIPIINKNYKKNTMKKKLFSIIAFILFTMSYSQDVSDALRYSMDNIQGTARFRAMGGAFGALGGDLSAVSINPAGSAVFSSSHASFTFSLLNKKNETQFFNGQNNSTDTKFDVNQGGAMFVFDNANQASGWKKFTLGFNYDKTADYDNTWFSSGTNNRSIDNYFLNFADGKRLDEISVLSGESFSQAYADIGNRFGFGHQQAFLGFESFIIDPVNNTDDNTQYVSNIAPGSFNQQNSVSSRGYNGKFSFNFAGQFKDVLYLGANLNTHFINYRRSSFFTETNNNPGSLVNTVNFENNIFTTGAGFSFQLGSIVKLSNLRLGLAYDSPTWYRIDEETSQFIRTVRTEDGSNIPLSIDPRIVNIFPEYRLKTPGRITASMAYVIGSQGLISVDYSRKDYGNTEFRPTSDVFFRAQNQLIASDLTVSNTIRLGGEYRIKQASLRAGYRFEESPYNDTTIMGDLNAVSFGFGYTFGNVKLDLAYEYVTRDLSEQLFNTGLTDSVQIDETNNNVFLTLAFNL